MYSEPWYNEPRYSGPRYNEPRYNEPRIAGAERARLLMILHNERIKSYKAFTMMSFVYDVIRL